MEYNLSDYATVFDTPTISQVADTPTIFQVADTPTIFQVADFFAGVFMGFVLYDNLYEIQQCTCRL